MNKPFILTCDASRSGLGFILGQLDENNRERVIEFGGRALHGSEKNYSVSEIECFAIVEGVKAYKAYLSTDIPFTIITDHKALICLNSMTNSQNGRLARWALFLQGFRYNVVYRKGEQNAADALSRLTQEAQANSDLQKESQSFVSALFDKQPQGLTIEPDNPNRMQNHILSTESSSENLFNMNIDENQVSLNSEGVNHISSIIENVESKQEQLLEVTFEYETQKNIFTIDTKQNENIASDHATDENPPEISLLQKQCPDFKHVYNYLAEYELPEEEKIRRTVLVEKEYYDLVDGILIHRFQYRSKKKPVEENFIFQTAHPKSLRLKVMQEFHDGNGHFRFKKAYTAIQAKYYWPRMFQEITDFVKSCDRCQRAKREAHPHTTQLNPLPVAKVFERLHIDLVGPLPKTKAGHEHILVCVDSFSRWVEAFPLHDQSATTIARVLHDEIFCRFGAPVSIVTDRGRNFLSKLVNAVCEIYKVSRHMTASYNPRANGSVKRQNASIAQTIRM